MKRMFLLAIGCLVCIGLKAQRQQLFDEYRREAGDQAEMFVGKAESGYPSTIYMNHPYWLFDEFSSGNVVYNGLSYKNVSLRYDAYLKQLVVNTPVKHSNVYVPMDRVEKFTLGDTEYARRNGEFMAILYSSPRMELVEQVHSLVLKCANLLTLKTQPPPQKNKKQFRRSIRKIHLRWVLAA